MLNAMPTDLKLWDEYRRMRDDSLRNDGDGSQATEFYRRASGRNGRRRPAWHGPSGSTSMSFPPSSTA